MGPTNQPRHIFKGEWKSAELTTGSKSGISLAYMTIDSEEHATRFIKDLFHNGLVSAVQMMDAGFDRSYLKFGQPATEKTRVRLEITLADDNVAKLIDFTNNNNPTPYDYPVPDVVAIPIVTGNSDYISWAKGAGKIEYDKIDYAKW